MLSQKNLTGFPPLQSRNSRFGTRPSFSRYNSLTLAFSKWALANVCQRVHRKEMLKSLRRNVLCALFLFGCLGIESTEQTRASEKAGNLQTSRRTASMETSLSKDSENTLKQVSENHAPPQKKLNDSPRAPSRPEPLDVPGFHAASHVGPDADATWPKPVVVVLHGNYDRPEWQCETWKAVAGFYGWLLCPRGKPTPWAPKSADRWLYRGRDATQKEIEAGLDALENKYKGRVTRSGMILVGFSLGAIYAPALVAMRATMYSCLFLIEGGVDKIDKQRLRGLKRAGVQGIGFAMSSPKYREATMPLVKKALKLGMKSVYVDMRGAGHNYRRDFDVTGKEALQRLVSEPKE